MSKRVQVSLKHQATFDAAAPVVATFRNGPPPPGKRKDLAFEVFENTAKKQRLVVANTERVAYQGANFGYLTSSNDCASYVVGVYDKNTQEVRLCNINQIYMMQQTVKGSTDNVDENRGAAKSYMEKKRDLVEAFGSKKSKRIQKSIEENIVNVQNVSGAASITETLKKQMEKAQEDSRKRDAQSSAESAALATRNALLPPHNLDAATPEQVYNIRKFINPHVMESLKMKAEEWIEAFKTTSVADYAATNNFPAVVTRLLLSLRTPYDKTKLGYLVYLKYLLDLFHLHFPLRKSPVALSEEKGIPLVVLRSQLALFTDSAPGDNGYTNYLQPKQKRDKLIVYMIVVALTINGFSLDLTELATDLKRSAVSLSTYCRQLGCSVEKGRAETAVYGSNTLASKKQSVHRAVLSLPLQFPAVKRGVPARR
ncbi:hypothetical protein Poli38472_012701 [Pythium oligandrum]|uniref:DNA-directed RNA polymerase I subunit RPA49 n=1 Tax=Pythium oligandrum TaxID=41045 RepID=A0A8K1CE42_PYTOL|nr:hypothetical protein Poli38472_012701 [Pythium oligandrum]|eukprot:TMW61510.1 hypothetical protein Poli38472_012701 [Pythium oligandrum]